MKIKPTAAKRAIITWCYGLYALSGLSISLVFVKLAIGEPLNIANLIFTGMDVTIITYVASVHRKWRQK